MTKKLLSLLLCVVVLFSFMNLTAFAADDYGGLDPNADNLTITFTKVWDDNNDVLLLRPSSISVTLYKYVADVFDPTTAEAVETATVKASENWKYDFDISEEEPLNANNVPYKYAVVETPVANYTETAHTDPTHTFIPPTVGDGWARITPCSQLDITTDDESGYKSLVIAKKGSIFVIWSYAALSEAERQTIYDAASKEVGGMKYANCTFVSGLGGAYSGMTITETKILFEKASDWSWFLTGTYYKGGSETTAASITNTVIKPRTSVSVSKVWEDADNQDGIRAQSITVQLMNGSNEIPGKTLTLSPGNNWTGSFDDLEMYDADYRVIDYRVKETTTTPGYSSIVTGTTPGRFVITNTHVPETTSVSGVKTWDDEDNNDGVRPSSITINLLKNGAQYESKTVSAETNWGWTFDNLPKYENGNLITYSITENQVRDYSTTYDGYNVTNKYTPKKTSVSVSKAWDDADDQDGKRPQDITVQLFADGVDTGKTLVLSEGNNWTGSFTDLYVYKAGQRINYTIKEVTVRDYTSVITGSATNGYTVTNTHVPETTSVNGAKTWDDDGNNDGKRPSSITVNLLKDGVKIDSMVVTANDNWSYSFDNLPKYKNHGTVIVYSITEEAVENYTTTYSAYNITNSYTPSKISVSVSKAWNDKNDQDGIRPGSVTVQLYANNILVNGKVLTLNEANHWTASFTELPEYKAGQKIAYTIGEVSVPSYTTELSGNMKDGFVITNSHTPATVTVNGVKTWNDEGNNDGKRPASITVNLLKNGAKIKSATVTAADGWKYSFAGLDKYENHGRLINYSITEEAVANYNTTYNGYNITNTHEISKVSVSVVKAWNDKNDQDGIRPANVTVQLYADGVAVVGKTVTLNENNRWTSTFTGLNEYKAGQKISYTVKESSAISGYQCVVTGNATNGFTITNSHTPAVVNIRGAKTWNDVNDNDGKRPASITVNLLKNGVKIDSATVTAANGWTWNFTNLDKYENHGTAINYSVTEQAVSGYSTTYNGYNITNTHELEEVEVTVSKVWEDMDNNDGKRPASITVQLYADGTAANGKTLTLTEAGQWTATFTELLKYNAGSEIAYTVEEIGVEGYEANISGNAQNGYVVTNTHEPELTTVIVSKVWNDKDNQDGKRPESITVQLYADGKAVEGKTLTLNKENEWKGAFEELYKYSKGQEVVYTVQEIAVDGYEATVEGDALEGYVVTNTHETSIISVSVAKSWDDQDDKDSIRPDSITVKLLADGVVVEGVILELNAENNWTGSFADLDEFKAGQKIVYTIEEISVDGYECVITGDAASGFTVTNTHTPEEKSPESPKTGSQNDGINWAMFLSMLALAFVSLSTGTVAFKKSK